jgi:hypothetical protein
MKSKMKESIDCVKHTVAELTEGLNADAYIEFMRELAEWASNQADMAEYDEDEEAYNY